MTHDPTKKPSWTSLNPPHDTKHGNKTTCITIKIHCMILDMIQGCGYLRRSTDRWLLSKNSTTRLGGLESWHGANLLWNCSIPITNTKGLYLYPGSNMTPSRPWLQYLLPKINIMASCPSRIHHQLASFFVFSPRHHVLPNASTLICGTALLSNEDVLPTADASTECSEENLMPNGVLLPNSAHMWVSTLYQFFGVNRLWIGILGRFRQSRHFVVAAVSLDSAICTQSRVMHRHY
jgi:hypothetical protein